MIPYSTRLWLLGFLVHFTFGMDNTGPPNLQYGPGTITSLPGNTERWLSPRQAPLPTNPNPTTSTYDFWWPFPAATAPPPTTTSSSPSIAPILISIVPNSSVAPNSVITPSTTPSTTTSPTSQSSSTSASSSVQSTTSSGTPVPAAAPPSFHIVELVPAFAAVGVVILGLIIWIVYGCCTRRPRVRTDDGELLCGPPYVSRYENIAHRDIEERGQDEQDEMLHIPKYGRRGISGQYRWPSFNQPPPFDPAKGFYVPDEYKEEDEDKYFDASLIAPQANIGRSSSFHTRRSSRSRRSAAAAIGNTGPSRSGSPPCSDSTSIALLELYESDEEEVAQRKAKETPWESLRHKSIKRGILEQVKKDSKWMDSIRSSIAGGPGFLSRGSSKSQKERPSSADDDASIVAGEAQRKFGRRRGHAKADSDLYIDPATSASTDPPISDAFGHVVPNVRPLNITKPKATLDSGRPGVRRGFTWLKDVPESVDKLTQRSIRSIESRSKSQSRSRSSSPIKVVSKGAGGEPSLGAGLGLSACRDILPQSPSQIMSPPLESQMCFTPIPLTIAKMPTPSKTRSKSRSRAGASPTKIPTARKGRRPHSPTPSSSSFPDPGGVNPSGPRSEESRGRLLKKKFTGPDFFSPSKSSRNKKASDHLLATGSESTDQRVSSAANVASSSVAKELW